MIKVYGQNEDEVAIRDTVKNTVKTVKCKSQIFRIKFLDGALITVSYPKENMAVWKITVEIPSVSHYSLKLCTNENAAINSDIYSIQSEVVFAHEVNKEWFK